MYLVLALAYDNRFCRLIQPSPLSDHKYAKKYYSLVWPELSPIPACALGNCRTAGEFCKLPYQANSQPQLSHVPVGVRPLPITECLASWPLHVLVGAVI